MASARRLQTLPACKYQDDHLERLACTKRGTRCFSSTTPALRHNSSAHHIRVERKIKALPSLPFQPGHPLKNAFVIVTFSTLLSACALSPVQPGAPRPAAAKPAPSTVASTPEESVDDDGDSMTTPAASAKEETNLPPAALTPDIFFRLLTADIAFQRGEWQGPYMATLGIAQQTRDPRLARRAVEIALAAKRPDEALAAVRLWRELAPQSEEATQYFLGFIILGNDLTEAKPILAQRLQQAPSQARSLVIFQVQRILAGAKDKAAAFTLLEELLTPYKALPETHIALAQGALAKSNSTQAIAEARLALAAKPDSELAALTLAQAIPEPENALASLANFLQAHPGAREVRIAYARMLVDQKQYAKARLEFEKILKAQPQDPATLYALGILSTQSNDSKSAEKYLKTFLEVTAGREDDERDTSQVLLILAQIADERGDFDGALKWLDKIEPVPGQNGPYFGAQIKRAELIAKRGNLDAARKLLTGLPAESEREQVQVLLAEARILRDANQAQEAFAILAAGLKRHVDNTDLLYDYAMTAEKLDNMAAMESALRKVMALNPDSQQAYNALGYSLAERNIRLPEALSLIGTALKLAPDDPFIMDSMGWVQFRLGNLQQAEELLRTAYALRPDVEIAAHLGEVLWNKGLKSDAQNVWRAAISKDPKNETLKNTLTRLNVQL
jgi:tetratricopeptide (TPR) repeat protein